MLDTSIIRVHQRNNGGHLAGRAPSGPVERMSSSDMAALHRWITIDLGTPMRAIRTIEGLLKAFNLAIQWRWTACTDRTGSAL